MMFVFLFAIGLGATAGLLGGFQTLPPPTTFNGARPATLVVVAAVLAVSIPALIGLVWVLRNRNGQAIFSQGAAVTLLALVLVLLVTAGLMALGSMLDYHRVTGYVPGGNSTAAGGNTTTGNSTVPNGNSTNTTAAKGPPPPLRSLLNSPYAPMLLPLTIGIILSLVLVPLISYALRRGRTPAPPAETGPPELVQHLEQAVASLEMGDLSEARAKIVSAYGALLRDLETRGVGDLDLLTPREIELLMESRLGLSSPSAHSLRELFEEARYSEHSMSEAQAAAARASLVEILEQLKARLPSAGAAETAGPRMDVEAGEAGEVGAR